MSRKKIPPPTAAYPVFLRNGWGRCADPKLDPNLFTEVSDRGEERRKRIAAAKLVCAGCPFQERCAAWAVDTNQTGVWGGTTSDDRAWTRRRQVAA